MLTTAQHQMLARLVVLAAGVLIAHRLVVLAHLGRGMQVALVGKVLAGKGLVAAVREQSEQTL
jgi:hypothetical protein